MQILLKKKNVTPWFTNKVKEITKKKKDAYLQYMKTRNNKEQKIYI